MKRFVLAIAFFIGFVDFACAQNGSIRGKVIDSKTGETLPGASIAIEGTTKGASTDFDGNYSLNNIAPGKYKLACNFISYNKKVISDVEVVGGVTTTIDFTMEEANTQLAEVIIEAKAKQESNMSLTLMQKNNIRVADGVTAETIRKTPDRSSSDVLKRISGTTIQDNKFVIIRGLNDRYNAAFLNGTPLPSSESDRKAFSFDIFPAAMLDNITILKTATPDLPADFAGGVIQINTRAIPEENTQSVAISGGYNTITTFKNSYTYKGGKYDFLGIDDGTRALPHDMPKTDDFRGFTTTEKADVAKLMKNDWALQNTKAAPNYSLQYTLGRRGKIFKNDAGSFFALTYNNTSNNNTTVRKEFEEQSGLDQPMQVFELTDSSSSNNVLAGALWNASYNIGSHTQISLKNIFNINSTDQVVIRNGERTQDGNYEHGSVRLYTQNILNSHQLSGDHLLGTTKIKINWIGGFSNIERSIPNLRRMMYTKAIPADPNDPSQTTNFSAAIPSSGTSPNAGGNIFYSKNKEQVYSGTTNITIPLGFMPAEFKTEIKGGIYYQKRERDFTSRQFGYSQMKNNSKNNKIVFEDSLLSLNESQLFASENLGIIKPFVPSTPATYDSNGNVITPATPKVNGVGGFKLEEATKLNDSYTAQSDLKVAYLMADNKLFDKLRLIWGVRAENYRQQLQSFEDDGDTITVDTTNIDFLPSANLIYSLNDKINVRLSYYKTLSRPEFRELAPFGFFDYVTFYSVRGNPLLKRATINNYDFRFEYYPAGGQIISASLFYKEFSNAIEQINRADVPRELYYQNIEHAQSYGTEIEYRLNFGHLLNRQDNKVLMNTSMYTNFSYIISKVDVSQVAGSISDSRPLQGQSPYIINAGAQYNDNEKGYSLSVVYNKVGRRILIVGNDQEPNIYENPRDVMDIQFGKVFFKKLDVKVNIRDLFAQNLVFYEDIKANGKYDKDFDNTMVNTRFGSTYSVLIAYKF